MLVGERPQFVAIQTNRANKVVLLKHRHRQIGSSASDVDEVGHTDIFVDVGLFHPKIGNVGNLFGVGEPIERHSRIVAQVNHRIALPRVA